MDKSESLGGSVSLILQVLKPETGLLSNQGEKSRNCYFIVLQSPVDFRVQG